MAEVRIITPQNVVDLYAICSPSEEATKESAEHFVQKIAKGWQGVVAYEGNKVVGRIELMPIEESLVAARGENLYFMPCIWVHPENQKKGYGKMMLEKVLFLAKDRKGIATVAFGKEWMPVTFFEHFGFETVQQEGPLSLMLKKFTPDANVEFTPTQFKPKKEDDKVNVEFVYSLKCPYMVANYKNAMKKASQFSDKVKVAEYVIENPEDILKYGDENIYVDGETPFFGPVSEEKLENILKDKLKEKNLL